VTPTLRAVYDELVERAAQPPFGEQARELRAAFLNRCGRLDPSDPAAEGREAAAWEDALVRGGLALRVGAGLEDPSERATAASLAHAHRGIYVFRELGQALIALDLWAGGEFVMLPRDDVGRELAAAGKRADSPLCQARLLATPDGCAVLPGTIFHPLEARAHLDATLSEARARQLETDAVLDAVLKMEHTWHTLSRVKPAYAYRVEALPPARG
jgi:hypothetical protein